MAKITVVKLGASWCVSCATYEKVLEQYLGGVLTEYPTTTFKALDVDETEGAVYAKEYNVRGLPTTLFLKESEDGVSILLKSQSGVISQTLMQSILKELS